MMAMTTRSSISVKPLNRRIGSLQAFRILCLMTDENGELFQKCTQHFCSGYKLPLRTKVRKHSLPDGKHKKATSRSGTAGRGRRTNLEMCEDLPDKRLPRRWSYAAPFRWATRALDRVEVFDFFDCIAQLTSSRTIHSVLLNA